MNKNLHLSDNNEEICDVLVIGGGPGGYVAAIRAAQLGGKVVLVERDILGGTCLNRGCIPTKTLLHSTEYIRSPKYAEKAGINLQCTGIDLKKLISNKAKVVEQLVKGINHLVKKNKIQLINGRGHLIDANTVEITTKENTLRKKTKAIIIATGSKTASLPVPGYDLKSVITSEQALNMDKIPKNIVVIGGGAVGIEFAFIYHNLGAEVTIVEMMPQLLPQMDSEVVEILERTMKQRGIKIYKNTKVEQIDESTGGVVLQLDSPSGKLKIRAEQVLSAIGRMPVSEDLNLSVVGIKTDRGRIIVDNSMKTNIKGIYAIGDVIGGVLLAHVASAEGVVAAENAMGTESKINYKVIPGCIYSTPELAGVGLTEKEAREKGYEVGVGKFPFAGCGKAIAIGATEGLAKIVVDKKHGEILGVHLVGERATDIIGEAALAIQLEATIDELTATIHAHPTIAETLFEAAHAVHNRAIHLA